MKISFRTFVLILLTALVLVSCGTTGNGVLYTERSINPTDVRFKRVAVLPNRLPLNLSEPEKWKKFNWEVMKKRFEREGLLVIDYNTSVDLFNKSGLPLEDTKISRDKYAELAEELGADILVFPYYGTSFRITGITDKNNYEVTGSLQIYLAEENDFMARIDIEGNNFIHSFSKLAPFVSMGLIIGSTMIYDETVIIIGSAAGGAVSLYPVIPFLTSTQKRYEKAFKYAINRGLDQFFGKYQSRNVTQSAPAKPVQAAAPTSRSENVQQTSIKNEEPAKPALNQGHTPVQPAATPAGEKPLSYYSVDELNRMKQTAVDAKDFRKAQSIKEEIEKRTK